LKRTIAAPSIFQPPRTGGIGVVVVLAAIAAAGGCRTAAIDPTSIADAQLAARVKTALVNDPLVGTLAIEVRAIRGVAELSGRVPSREDAERVADLARAVQGVTGVRSNLVIGALGAPPASRGPARELESTDVELDAGPGLLALGASLGSSIPSPEALESRVSLSPLIKIGAPRGMGPAVGFDWFHADLESVGGAATLTRVHVRPVMGGVGYTWSTDRFSLTTSVVAGYSFNSLTVTETGIAQGLPVEVANSFAWRVGASLWHDIGRRLALNVSTGYLMSGLRLTVLDGGRLSKRDASGDTTILHAGVAYRLF
jgi:hypothetical protein